MSPRKHQSPGAVRRRGGCTLRQARAASLGRQKGSATTQFPASTLNPLRALDEVNARGFNVLPGELGENITTRGVDLLGLPTGARLQIGEEAVVEVTGLRSPCVQVNTFQEGLLEAVIERRKGVGLVRKTGVMSVVIRRGVIRNGDAIEVRLPDGPHEPLAPV